MRHVYNRVIAREDMTEFITRHVRAWAIVRDVVRGIRAVADLTDADRIDVLRLADDL